MKRIDSELTGQDIARRVAASDLAKNILAATKKRQFGWLVYFSNFVLGVVWGFIVTQNSGQYTQPLIAVVAGIAFFLVVAVCAEIINIRKRIDALVVLTSNDKL